MSIAPITPSAVPEISVAIPTYNEEDNVVQIAEAVMAELAPLTQDYEVVIIDNGSADRTRELIRELCARYPQVRGIFNTRNFGQMRSPTHAIYACRGRAVINLCADFQDPPNLIPEFIQAWRQGAPIVLGVRAEERSGRRLSAMRRLSYAALGALGEVQTIAGATGFGLYDRKVLEVLQRWNDPEPFFRAMLVESGFPITCIYFERKARERGESKNGLLSLTAFALSAMPLVSRNVFRLAFTIGFLLFLAGVVLMALTPVPLLLTSWGGSWFCWGLGTWLVGAFTTLLGMIGLQVMSVSDRTRGVPLVIELERINFPPQ